jgi:hypothetical protein
MNVMAEKLKEAGVDTVGARLTTACIEALRRHPDSSVDAWRYVWSVFGHEFIRGLMHDMQNKEPAAQEIKSPPTPLSRGNHAMANPVPYKPRVIPPERLEKRRELRELVRSKYMNSGGIAWSDVGWHELTLLRRDGKEAAALLDAGPASVPNDGRSVGDVLGIKRVDEIVAAARNLK